MKITYKIKPKKDEQDSSVTFIKRGQTHEFTDEAVRNHMKELERITKELSSQRDMEAAKMKNIEQFNEIVMNLSDKQLLAIAMYAQSKDLHGKVVAKLAEIEKLQKEYLEETQEIEKQTGIKIL